MKKLSISIKGEGKPVVLIHGFPLSSKIWDQQKSLSERYQLILPDLPGSGKSNYSPFDLDSLADILHHELHESGINNAVLMGHSMGGYLALAYAEKYAHELTGFGLICSHPFADSPETKAARMKMIDRVRNEGADFVAEAQIPKIFSDFSIKNRKTAVAVAYDVMRNIDERAVINGQEAMAARPERVSVLTGLTCPIFIANGADDPTIPEKRRIELLNLVPNAVSVLYNDVGHMPMMEAGDAFTLELEKFLSRF